MTSMENQSADKPWDNSMSLLIRANPQAFLDLLFPETYCLRQHRTKLKNTQRQPDAVLEVQRHGEQFIANVEFQASGDHEMPQRLLLYAILLLREHKLSISSFAIYLFRDKSVKLAPFSMKTPGKEQGDFDERIQFHYNSLKMWDVYTEELLRLGHAALYPLLPLTKDGATRQIVDQMFTLLSAEEHLSTEERRDLELVGFGLASGIFSKSQQFDDLAWLERKYGNMYDILRETPFYQWVTRDARAEGLTEGRVQGRAEGQISTARKFTLNIIRKHFPTLLPVAEKRIDEINSLSQLEHLANDLLGAQQLEQARQILFDTQPE